MTWNNYNNTEIWDRDSTNYGDKVRVVEKGREAKKKRNEESKGKKIGVKMNVETVQYFGQKVSLPYKKVEDAFQ